MRRLSGVIGATILGATVLGAMILAITIYFTLFWGYDALRILTSPGYGLEDVWRSQVVFGIGRYAGFGPAELLQLAAALGALKLVVAGVCAMHVFDRMRRLFARTKPANEILETALIVAVAISIASLVPAILSSNADLAREQLMQVILAGLTAVVCMVERGKQKDKPAVVAAGLAPATAEPLVLR